MPRSPVSAADRALIAELADRRLACSVFQLERWRAARLLPRASLTRQGAAGSRAVLPAGSVEAAVVLAAAARRGRPAQELALALFAAAAPVPDETLTTAVAWAAHRFDDAMTAHVAAVRAEAASAAGRTLPDHDVLADAESLAVAVVAGNGPLVRSMRRRARRDHPGAGREERDGIVLGAVVNVLAAALGAPTHQDSVPDLLGTLGVHDAAGGSSGAVARVLAGIDSSVLCAVAERAPAELLWQARQAHLDQAVQVRDGWTTVRSEADLAHPGDPIQFALEVLAFIAAVLAQAEADPDLT